MHIKKSRTSWTSNLRTSNLRALQSDGTIIEYTIDEIVASTQVVRITDIFDWCSSHEIDTDLIWAGEDGHGVRSKWGIKDEQHRTMFVLRWA